MRDRRSTDERAKRSGIKIEKNWAENGASWNSAGKRGCTIQIATVDCLRARAHKHTHTDTHSHTHSRTNTHQHTHTYAQTHARTYARTRLLARLLAHTHTHTHARTHIHTHASHMPTSPAPNTFAVQVKWAMYAIYGSDFAYVPIRNTMLLYSYVNAIQAFFDVAVF